jgi:multisubunit Na+/H+ antiporter MnhC subunit
MRIYAITGALLAWFALLLQLYLVVVQSPPGWAVLGGVITYFSFFTILTNLLVALVFTAIAVGAAAGWVEFFSSSSVQGGAAVYIAIVGIVYQLLLRQLWNPRGAQLLADMLLHAIIPLGYVVYWLIFAPRAGLRWRDAGVWLVYPGVYLLYVLARGAVTGLYPYPFVDVKVLGYAGVLARAVVLMAVFLGMGLLLVAVSRWMRAPKGWIQPSPRN